MVNEWQQRNSGRTVPGAFGSYSDESDTKLDLPRGLTSSQEQPTPSTTTTRGISSSQTFPYFHHGSSASTKQGVSDQTGHPLTLIRQGSIPEGIQSQVRPLASQFHRTSGLISASSPRTASTAAKGLSGGDEGGQGDIDEDEVESDDNDDDNDEGDDDDDDENDDDDDNDPVRGKTEASDPSKGRQRTSSSKAKRFRLTHNQTRFLMGEFARQTHPDGAQRRRLSKEIPGLSPRQVQVWFQNRRAKLKRLPAQDREKVMKSRALPEDFDISRTLRSPFVTDASKDFSNLRQNSLYSPSRSSTLQTNEGIRNRNSIDASSWTRVPGEGYTASPLSLATEFSPYLAQMGQSNNPMSSTILSNSPEIDPFSYEQHQQAHPQLIESTIRPADFSSTVPGPSMQLHTGQEQQPQAQLAPNASSPLRFRRSSRSTFEPSNQNQGDTVPRRNTTNTFEIQNEENATFANIPPEAIAFWNNQLPLQSSPGQYYDFHQNLALQASPAPLPQSFPGRAPLQIDTTQPQPNESTILHDQQASPGYARTIYNTRQARSRQMPSPAAAYQTPISATLQGLPLQNTEDDVLLRYQLDTGKEIAGYNIGSIPPSGVAESYQEYQGQFRTEPNMSEQAPKISIPGRAYKSPYQLIQSQPPNVIQVTGARYDGLARTAGFGELPPTPQSAGLKRRYYEEGEANPSQVSTSQKRRKRSAVSSAYKSQDPGPQPPK